MPKAIARDRLGVLGAALGVGIFAVVGLASAAPGCGGSEGSTASSGGDADASTTDSGLDGALVDTSLPPTDSTLFDGTFPDFAPHDHPEADAPLVFCAETGGDAADCPLPAPTCLDATWLLAYADATCVDGTCRYTAVYTDCTATGGVCSSGACTSVILK